MSETQSSAESQGHTPSRHADQSRIEDPNLFQRRAAHPDYSVWVGASAGSGKTKVLTDRLLRLLLPRADGRPGTPPEKILCLTFTKAAASEMALRLNRKLGSWAVMSETDLRNDLHNKLLGRPPSDEEMKAARELFARVVDAPGGLNIMTIHAFCQSVLGRFPLEAGLPPQFTALDETQSESLRLKARNHVLDSARTKPDSPEGQALRHLAAIVNEDAFSSLLQKLIQERHQLTHILDRYGGVDNVYQEVCRTLGIEPGLAPEDVVKAACRTNAFNERDLRHICRLLAEHGTAKTDQPKADLIQAWLDRDLMGRQATFNQYKHVFLTQKNEIRARLATKSVLNADDSAARILEDEANRLLAVDDHLKAATIASCTYDLLVIGTAILDRYQAIKTAQAGLDFDDLINKTLALLQKTNMSSWVMYKLDKGLDHILVDEAQDTNPEQWDIIEALCEEFFSGYGARDEIVRTLFSVGDEKQSIYSFQRAAPEKFREKQTDFAERVQQAGLKWRNEFMRVSFRSTPSVLDFVDEVFQPEDIRDGLGLRPLDHRSWRAAQAGRVEVWPVFDTQSADDDNPWTASFAPVNSSSGAARLADYIACKVDEWCKSEILPSKGRTIEPGDILILVRRRTNFVNQLIRALKLRQIPVSGIDRMVLKDQLPVQDLLAVARFALLPEDNLSLACVLKSPLIGWTDEALQALALSCPAGQSLWQRLTTWHEHPGPDIDQDRVRDIQTYLNSFIAFAAESHPYEFFSRLLQRPCPASRRGGLYAITGRLGMEAVDPLEEFLNLALSYETTEIPTLQGFVQSLDQGDSVVKREQEEAGGRVRIMTVHGAKGLQAPVVILPDTVRTTRTPPDGSYRLVWPDKSGLNIPLWSPRRDTDSTIFTGILDELEQQQDREYRRLLYVAMTRAEDRLYIGGHTGRQGRIHDESWYNYVRQAIDRLEDVQSVPVPQARASLSQNTDDRNPEETGGQETEDQDMPQALVFDNPQTAPVPDKEENHETLAESDFDFESPVYSWVFDTPPVEPEPVRPLMPSRPSESDETPAQSPLAGKDAYRFRRGQVTHDLLQFLPDWPEDEREPAARTFLDRQAHDIPESVRGAILKETLAIVNNRDWAPLFGSDSQAEVPVTGMVGTDLVSGQVDRLYVRDDEIWIVDYKTNRPPPQRVEDIPALYRRQMGLYKAVIKEIYPGRAVRCFLLWTDGPDLMELHVTRDVGPV